MEIIARTYKKKLTELCAKYPVVFILGPRQCGKTTFVKAQLPEYEYLDLERPSDEARVRADPELFFESRKRPVIVDEAQRAPEIFPVLRALVDRHKKFGQFIVLGSASPDLVKDISESLAGRVGYLDMNVLLLEEVFGKTPDVFKDHWLKGGFPDAFLVSSPELNFDWFENYTRSLIERDLPALGIQLDPVQFRRLWAMLVLSHGDILNMNKLASAMGISPHTVDRYISILERSFLLRRLPPYFGNLKKRLVKSPKILVKDSGILHYFLRIFSYEDLTDSPHRGNSFEGYALEQLIQAARMRTPHLEASYFRTADGLEIDLLLTDSRWIFPIEIKSKLSPGKEDAEALFKARKLLGFEKAVILCPGSERYPLTEGVECIGIQAWAAEGFPAFWELDSRQEKAMAMKPSADPVAHPWRACPYGEHQVITHPRRNPPSKSHTEGTTSEVHWHCARNPSGKDHLYPDEIAAIASRHFSKARPLPNSVTLGFKNGVKYDELIAGWVQYWNEVLKPGTPLEPNLVKALIASESGFLAHKLNDKKDSNSARGLMQITNNTRKLLADATELHDHFINVTKEELNDPVVNICAGVRWLFRKREVASVVRLKRQATWTEAAEEYKGDLKGVLKGIKMSQSDVSSFLGYLKDLAK